MTEAIMNLCRSGNNYVDATSAIDKNMRVDIP